MVGQCSVLVDAVRADRPHRAISGTGVVLPLAWLAPVWVQWTLIQPTSDTIVGTGIDTKLGVGIALLVSYCFFKRSTYPLRFVPCDYAMAGLISVHLVSDVYYQGFQWIILGHIYAEWWVPYVLGRLAFQNRYDISRIWPVVVVVAIVLGCFSAVEMLTGNNLYELLAGPIPDEGRPGVAARWGLPRDLWTNTESDLFWLPATTAAGLVRIRSIAGNDSAPLVMVVRPITSVDGNCGHGL